MKSSWKQVSLGELQNSNLADIQTGPFGTVLKSSEYTKDGVPVISVSEIREGFLRVSRHTPRVNKEITNRLPIYILEEGDIVFGRKGAIDRNSIINKEQEGWFLGSDGIRLRLTKEINSTFVSYQLRSKAIGNWLLKNSSGSIMPSLNQKILDRLLIWLPELKIQSQIAFFLRSIDAKIELNTKINAELEAMTKTIYDYWFVQFDFPNAKGKPYKTSGGKMVWNKELKREIPEGWEVKLLNTIFDYLEGPGIRKFNYASDGHKFINIRCIQDGDLDVSAATQIKNELVETYAHFQLKENDVVVSTSASLGRSAIVRKEHLPLLLNTSVIRFRPLKSTYYSYMNVYLKSEFFLGQLNQLATGSIQKNFGPTHLDKITDCIPPENIFKLFNDIIQPIINKQLINKSENEKLSSLRDWLLPMLMNGQVKVN